jgi:hypothetical protein
MYGSSIKNLDAVKRRSGRGFAQPQWIESDLASTRMNMQTKMNVKSGTRRSGLNIIKFSINM